MEFNSVTCDVWRSGYSESKLNEYKDNRGELKFYETLERVGFVFGGFVLTLAVDVVRGVACLLSKKISGDISATTNRVVRNVLRMIGAIPVLLYYVGEGLVRSCNELHEECTPDFRTLVLRNS